MSRQRERTARPIIARPISIIAQVLGSGTALRTPNTSAVALWPSRTWNSLAEEVR